MATVTSLPDSGPAVHDEPGASCVPTAEPDALRGKRVLLDGYNLELAHGTGIKTYGVALAGALRDLGARVGILSSCRRHPVAAVQDAFLNEGRTRAAAWGELLAAAVRPLLGLSLPAAGHAPDPAVLCNAQGESMARLAERYYLAPHSFAAANRLFGAVGRPLRVSTPERIHLWHATYHLPISVKGARTITTVHDLIPLKLPWATLDDKRFYYRVVRRALGESDLVVTVSESARNDILATFGGGPERVEVVYQAITHTTERPAEEVLAERLRGYRLRPQGYLLFVGAIQPRKNLGRLCRALQSLNCRVPLVAVGGKGWLWEEELREARPLLASRRLVLLSHVPQQDLQALYAGALFLAFPSLYEGFALPPLEAMAQGCPVLTSETSSLPEICGDAAVYVNPFDVSDMADKLRTLLADEGLRQRLRSLGSRRAALFTRDRYRRRIHELHARVLR